MCKGKDTQISIQKLLHSIAPNNKWVQKLETGSFPASPFLETPHTFYNTDHEI